MNLYKNGFVVAEINAENFTYNAWPLSDLTDDEIVESLTDEADDNWFVKYNMQHIIPDSNYIKIYLDYCNSINRRVKVLLFESLDNNIVIDDELEICEVLGFDCIGTVYHSYLQTEINDFKSELLEKNILLGQINNNSLSLLPERIDEIMQNANTRKFKEISIEIVKLDPTDESIGYNLARAIFNVEVGKTEIIAAYETLIEYQGNAEFYNAVIKLKNVLDNDENINIIASNVGLNRTEIKEYLKSIDSKEALK